MSVRRTLLVLAASLALLQPAQAFAGSYHHTDPSGDVLSETDNSNGSTKAPGRAEGDVLSSAVVHAKRKVFVSLHFRALTRTTSESAYVFRFRTDKHKVRDVTVVAGPGHWNGHAGMSTLRGRKVRCAVSEQIDYAHRSIRVAVPRRCLGRPHWIQLGSGMVSVQGSTFYGDDALTNGVLHDNPVFGPKVRKG